MQETARNLVVCAAFVVLMHEGAATDLPELDSTAFDCKYEMEVLPTEQDLDGDGTPDFARVVRGESVLRAENGYAVVDARFSQTDSSKKGACYIYSDSSSGGAWPRYGATAASGFTVEARIATRWHTDGAWALCLTADVDDSIRAMLNFRQVNGEFQAKWGDGTMLTNMVFSGDFQTWRIARPAGSSGYYVWCDGNLVGENLGNANSGSWGLLVGVASGAWYGGGYVSYLRFTKGGYAPTRMKMDSRDFAHKYEMDSDDTRFSATASASDWSLAPASADGTASLSRGVLSATVPQGGLRYWESGPMDTSIAASSPFTLEMKLRVHDAWDAKGRVLYFTCGTPRAFCHFIIGTDSVRRVLANEWDGNERAERILHEGDNSSKMHVFRIAYTGDGNDGMGSGGFVLWRDGELVAENIPAFRMGSGGNNVVFGIGSRSYGGSFDVNYIRWTTDGVFAPPDPPPPLGFSLKIQ